MITSPKQEADFKEFLKTSFPRLSAPLFRKLERLQEERDALLKVAERIPLSVTAVDVEDSSKGIVLSLESYDAVCEALYLIRQKGGKLPYEKPRIIEEFPVTTAA